jgi:transposase
LQSYQRVSRDIQLTIINACRARQSFTAIASRFHLSVSTVIRYFDYIQYAKPRTLPAVLSLDEFKGNAWGQKYQVSLTSPVQHKVLDILPKRDTTAIIRYFLTYPRAIRDQVKWVVIDMSPLFRKVLRQVFPHATIVGDRFHIYRLVLWAMEKVRTRVQKQFPKHSPYVKRNKSLLKKKGKTLKEDELVRLREVLSLSVELRRAYALKESFYRVLEMTERKSAEDTLQDWLELVESADLSEFKGLLHSFRDWNDPIIQAIIQPYSNGFTEGVNNKIKVLKRVSFGIQDFNRFRNRILCMS